jgi:hypothetical protein
VVASEYILRRVHDYESGGLLLETAVPVVGWIDRCKVEEEIEIFGRRLDASTGAPGG